jgi:HEAT repeat protein
MSRDHENWSARGRAPTNDEASLRAALTEGQPARRDAVLGLVDAAREGLSDETVESLAEIVRSDSDPDTRQFAVEALGVAGTGKQAIRTALDDGEPWVRAEAVVALSRTDPDATDRLRQCLDDDSGWVRRNALIALTKTGGGDEETYVDCIKQDPHPAVREYGAQYLRTGSDTERCVRILAAVLAREPNAFVRAKAAESLGEFGTDRAQEALEEFGIQDASDDVRRTAKQALARARGVSPDALDIDSVSAPGTGPETPADRGPGQRGMGDAVSNSGSQGRPPTPDSDTYGNGARPPSGPDSDPRGDKR